MVLHAAGHIDEAWAAVQRAIVYADASGIPAERGTTRKLAAVLLLARGLRGDAAALDAAAQFVDEMFPFLLQSETAAGLAEAALIAARVDEARGNTRSDAAAYASAVAWFEKADRWFRSARRETRTPTTERTDATQIAGAGSAAVVAVRAIRILLKHLIEPTAAFDWTERAKARALSELVGMGPLAPPAGVAAGLLANEARAIAQLAAADTHHEVWPAHAALEQAWEELAGDPAAGAYVAVRRGTAMSYPEVQALLAVEDARLRLHSADAQLVVVEFVILGDQLVVFGARSDWAEPAVAVISGTYAVLAQAITAMTQAPIDDLPAAIAALVADPQVRACVTPILDWTAPGDVVCIVGAGLLHAVPFHAIPAGKASLMERNPIFYAPSVTTLRACFQRRLPDGTADVSAVFSNPTQDLPAATREGAAVAAMLGVAAVEGAQATRDHVLGALARSTIVHVASHAAFDVADPLESAMELADGAVTARDVLASPGGRLRLVTLSACESGMHTVRAGDELLGLTRAVLYAGAASVLVTLWSVDDEATDVLMRTFYDRWLNRGEPKVLALAGAQRYVIAAGYSAPDEWAPFALIGDWL